MPTATGELGSAGTQTSAIGAGGYTTTYSNLSFTYDGTNWSNAPNLAANRTGGGAGGANSGSAVIAGGYPAGGSPSITWLDTAEEFNRTINTVTAAAWATGGALPAARYNAVGLGTQTAAVNAGGDASTSAPNGTSAVANTYDGTSWTAANSVPYVFTEGSSFGTQTAGVVAGGANTAPARITSVTKFDGTNWTSGTALPTATNFQGGAGIQTAGLQFGGVTPPGAAVDTTYEFDGSSWTSGGTLGTARRGIRGTGTQTAAVGVGGSIPPGTYYANVEEYNGSSWSEVTDLPTTSSWGAISGIQTNSLYFGGNAPPGRQATAFGYDGTNWSTRPSMSVAKNSQSFTTAEGGDSQGFSVGGYNGTATIATTEEYTGETTAINIETLTTS